MNFFRFVIAAGSEIFRGGRAYWNWLAVLGLMTAVGVFCYVLQFRLGGLKTTGLSEEVVWGIYIANFAFLIGIAAAAVMLVIPAYIFNQEEVEKVVIVGEGMAVAACIMAIMFIFASLGRPDRLWHILPFVGRLNVPRSMLAWDVVVINAYLMINIAMPAYILYTRYRNREPNHNAYFPVVIIAIGLAISIHTVTAFLFASNVSRPFWHTAILGPRFLASAFTSGPALLIYALQVIHAKTDYKVDSKVIDTLAIIMTVTLQINLFLLSVEVFTEFYSQTRHASSIEYLFFGIGEHTALVPWIWTSVVLNTIAVVILSVHKLRGNRNFLNLCCGLVLVGIWIEKGMGMVVTGFIPTPLGDIVEYSPTLFELGVMMGIWAFGTIIFTILIKMIIPIQTGRLRIKG